MFQKNLDDRVEAKRPAGRPRSQVSRSAILQAAYSFLQNLPVASISILHIARKAGVSSATVYRWWPTKEALLLEAFLDKADREALLQGEGTPLQRLKQYVLQVGSFFAGESGIVVARLLTAIQDNSTLRSEFMEQAFSPHDQKFRELVQEAMEQGQLPAETEVAGFLDTIIGPLLTRLLFRHEGIDEAFVSAVFDRVVAGTIALAAAEKR